MCMFRCKIWAQRSGNIALLAIEASSLHHRARLCEFHFDSQALGKNNKFLRKHVLPTRFLCPPLADALFVGYITNSEDTLGKILCDCCWNARSIFAICSSCVLPFVICGHLIEWNEGRAPSADKVIPMNTIRNS